MECLGLVCRRLCVRLRRAGRPANSQYRPPRPPLFAERPPNKAGDDALFWLFEEKHDDEDAASAPEETVSSPLVASEEEEDEEDLVCGICADGRATLAAFPCGHVACEGCWRQWLTDHESCWLCHADVKRLRREHHHHHHPDKGADADGEPPPELLERRVADVRHAVAAAVRRLVTIKHAARGHLVAIDEVAQHCRDLEASWGESTQAVLVIERLSLAESIAALVELTRSSPSSSSSSSSSSSEGEAAAAAAANNNNNNNNNKTKTPPSEWDLLRGALAAVESRADLAGACLDGPAAAPKAVVAAAAADAAHFGVDVLRAQWAAARDLLNYCLARLPNLKPILFSGADLDGFGDFATDVDALDALIEDLGQQVVDREAQVDAAFNAAITLVARLDSL